MEHSHSKRLDYFPLISYLAFFVSGDVIGSIMTGDPRLMKLGFVAIPALVIMIIAVLKVRNRYREQSGK